jgi:hypothetical protein
MSYQVNIVASKQEMQAFLDLPYDIYRDDPFWVAPFRSEVSRTLDPDKNPYFKKARLEKFICYHHGKSVARLAVIIHPDQWQKTQQKTAFFGFYESMNDYAASVLLFEEAEQYCRDQGAEYLEGPFNPNHYSELGMLTDNFKSIPVLFETYNPSYYPEFIKKLGYEPIKRLHTRINLDSKNYINEHYTWMSNNKRLGGFTIRNFNLLDFYGDLERIREVFNDAFSDNWRFLPLSHEEYLFSAKFLFLITNPKLVKIIEYNGKSVGVLQCVLNVNKLLQPFNGRASVVDIFRFLVRRRSIKEIVIYAVGVKKAYRQTRLFGLIHNEMCNLCQKYSIVSTTWMTDDNKASIRASEIIGLQPYKWFEIYRKSIKHQQDV